MVDLNLPAPGQSPNWAPQLNAEIESINSVITGLDPSGIPQEQYVGSNLSATRIDWPGPVYWITTSASGYPINARGGDTLWRISERDRQRTVYDNFSRADGPAGTTEEGGLLWQAIPGVTSGATPTIASNELSITGATSGSTIQNNIVGVETGSEGYAWFRVGEAGMGRNSALIFRATDTDNYISIALRTSETDPEARLTSRVSGTVTTISGLGVTLAPDDIVEVQMRGVEIEVKVNDTTRWSGVVASNVSGRWSGFSRHFSGNGARLKTFAFGLLA